MSEEKKLALLIDSDNVSAKYAPFILQEASKYGELSVKRIYGDWEKGGNGWHFPALNNAILPVQQTCYIAGKNATDFSMIIDAMDLLHSGTVDGFVLVTSDSDFTRLAVRLREAGKLVVGIGEVKTPIAFTASCHHFSFLNQVCDPAGEDYDENTIRAAVIDFVKSSGDKGTDLTKLDNYLTSKFGKIDYDRLGFKRPSNFVDSFPELRRNNTYILLKKQPSAPAPAPAAPAPAAPAPAPAPVATAPAPVASAAPAPAAPVPAVSESAVTREKIIELVTDYLDSHDGMAELAPLEAMLIEKLGKIDYSKYGIPGKTSSKYFSKFLDNLPDIEREGSTVRSAKTKWKATRNLFAKMKSLVASNPDGMNQGLLNQALVKQYGSQYYKEYGYSTFLKLLEDCPGLTLKKHDVFIDGSNAPEKKPATEKTPKAPAKEASSKEASAEKAAPKKASSKTASSVEIPFKPIFEEEPTEDIVEEPLSAEAPSKKASPKKATPKKAASEKATPEKSASKKAAPKKATPEKAAAKKATPEKAATKKATPKKAATGKTAVTPEKPEINSVKRFILSKVSENKNGMDLPALGELLNQKFGKGYLKELGFRMLKQLVSAMAGVQVKDNRLTIGKKFLSRTGKIEKFVYDYARSDSSRSIKALSTQIKKSFPGFDLTDYGYGKFSDFINAIDGVRANGYYIEPV